MSGKPLMKRKLPKPTHSRLNLHIRASKGTGEGEGLNGTEPCLACEHRSLLRFPSRHAQGRPSGERGFGCRHVVGYGHHDYGRSVDFPQPIPYGF